jgi:site-specific DNA-methyltransferase (adenine-specific)
VAATHLGWSGFNLYRMEYKNINAKDLIQFDRRDIRESVLNKLEERIKSGYNPARPLTVVKKDNKYLIADGNHRFMVGSKLGINEFPCVVRDGNEYTISIECNNDEDTYAPEDVFDKINTVSKLVEQGYTQEQIGGILLVSREVIKNINKLNNSIGTKIINLCKSHQNGRVPSNGTNVPFNFTEWWFRISGLYDLNEQYQIKTINEFIADKCNWSNTKLKTETTRYKLWMEMAEYVNANLFDQTVQTDIIQNINNGAFKTLNQLKSKIDILNQGAKNKLINGDCITELESIDDNSIDVVITDPPYGINYKSNASKYSNTLSKQGLLNDDINAISIFDNVCKVLNKKVKDDSHLYFFIDLKNYGKFRDIAEKYFEIKTSLVWYKAKSGIGDLEYDWSNCTEMIIYCIKGKKPINVRKANVLEVNRLSTSQMIHPTQKPTELIKQILEVSANKHDLVCDPFMGSGSHIKAAKDYGCNYIGIELDSAMFEKAKNYINEK